MSKGTYRKMHLALSGLCLAAMSSFAPLALAQIIFAPVQNCGSTTPGGTDPLCDEVSGSGNVGTGLSCPKARGANSCSANEFVGNANVQSNSLSICTKGDLLTNQSLSFTVTSSNTQRYGIGLFIAEQNQNLAVAGGTCSVVTFPQSNPGVTPYPWSNQGGGCGSYSKDFTSLEMVDGVSFPCNPDANGALQISYEVTYDNNTPTCTGPTDVAPGTGSKCAVTTAAPVGGVVVQYQADPVCSAGVSSYDPVSGDISVTFHIVNSGPDGAGPDGKGLVTFEDNIPGPATVTGVTCGNVAGGAVCGAVQNTGNDVTGKITTLPNGGSLDITISGNVPPGGSSQPTGNFTLSVDGSIVLVPANWVDFCVSAVQLPVHLQSFDVK